MRNGRSNRRAWAILATAILLVATIVFVELFVAVFVRTPR
jgi:hypothetical protein